MTAVTITQITPSELETLINDSVLNALSKHKAEKQNENSATWFNIAELCNYIPDHPARQTVYAWVQHRKIPTHKGGKKLRFLKSEIDEWLKQSKRLTKAEASVNVSNYLTSKKK